MRRMIAAGLLGLAMVVPAPVSAAGGDSGFLSMGDVAVANFELHPDGCYSFYAGVVYYDGERAGDLVTPFFTWSDVSVSLDVYERCTSDMTLVARYEGWMPVPPTIVTWESAVVESASFRIIDGAGDWLTATVDLTWTAVDGATPAGRTWGSASYRRTEVTMPAELAGTLTISDGNTGWADVLVFEPGGAFEAGLTSYVERSH